MQNQAKDLFEVQDRYNEWARSIMVKERPTRYDLCGLDQLIHETQNLEEEEYYKQRVVSVLLFVREQTKIVIDRLEEVRS